jgi:hypothetical protein
MIQRPSNLDFACALTLVQEEALDIGRKTSYMRYEPSTNMTVHRPSVQLQLPPKPDKPPGLPLSDDRKQAEAVRNSLVDDKFRALR